MGVTVTVHLTFVQYSEMAVIDREAAAYWIPAFAGMTAVVVAGAYRLTGAYCFVNSYDFTNPCKNPVRSSVT
jgi:hypothetical protein